MIGAVPINDSVGVIRRVNVCDCDETLVSMLLYIVVSVSLFRTCVFEFVKTVYALVLYISCSSVIMMVFGFGKTNGRVISVVISTYVVS